MKKVKFSAVKHSNVKNENLKLLVENISEYFFLELRIKSDFLYNLKLLNCKRLTDLTF